MEIIIEQQITNINQEYIEAIMRDIINAKPWEMRDGRLVMFFENGVHVRTQKIENLKNK